MTTFNRYVKYENGRDVVDITLSDGTEFPDYYVSYPRDNKLGIEDQVEAGRTEWLESNSEVIIGADLTSDEIQLRRSERQELWLITVDKMNPIWYDTLSDEEKESLREWRQAWLDYPTAGDVPSPGNHPIFSRAGTIYGYPTTADIVAGDTSFETIHTYPMYGNETISFTPDGSIYTVTTIGETTIGITPAYSGDTVPMNSKVYFR